MESINQNKKNYDTRLPIISFVFAFIGVTLSMWGASWDITSHLLRIPETFFTPSHGILYLGVGINVISAVFSAIPLIKKHQIQKEVKFSLKLIIVGSIMQTAAGPGDFYWHEMFGIDGLMSPTHIILALGIMVVSISSTMGFSRIKVERPKKEYFLKRITVVSLGVFWFSVMWFIFFFVLPISEGETHNFNPDPHVAIILSFLALPFVFSVVFWAGSRITRGFGAASGTAIVFMTMNITSNIITSNNLFMYLPWFAIPITGAIVADYMLTKNFENSFIQKHKEKIAGSIIGSMFFIFCFPMLSMTFLEVYVFNDVFSYDILHVASDSVFEIWMITAIPGAIGGMSGMVFASKKFRNIPKIE